MHWTLGQRGSATISSVRGSYPSRKLAESRRWLQRRVPRKQLYRLAPSRPRRKRFGTTTLPDHIRGVLRAWWAWLIVALLLQWSGSLPMAIAAGLLSFVLYHVSTETHPAVYPLEFGLDVNSPEFESTLEGVTGMPFVPGNSVTIHNNGDEFYPAMLQAVESATQSVTMEQYIFWDGQVGRRFAEAFSEKARSGIPVKLLLDAIGSATLGKDIFQILEAGGCQLAWFGPIHWYTLHRANRRDHRKSLVVDGQIAFTGGAGLADHWLGNARNPQEWRDMQVAARGPAALALQTGFAQNWLQATGEIISGSAFFPEVPPRGTVKVQTIQSSPLFGAGVVGSAYLMAIQCARRELFIANPYFLPDTRVTEMLAAARARGVAVKVMVAGKHIDAWWARQNSVRCYGRLLEAGVEIHEFTPTMLHQKTMVVDGTWATVGTANFDNRSFALNEETNLCFHDDSVVGRLRAIFLADLARCERVDLDTWRNRGVWSHVMEQGASVIENQL